MIGVIKINITLLGGKPLAPPATLGSELIALALASDLYASLKSARYTFCLRSIPTYSLGASFGMGNDNYLLAVFEFHGLSNEDQVLLMMRDNMDFDHDMSEYGNILETGCGWEIP